MRLLILGKGQYSYIVKEIAEEKKMYSSIDFIDDNPSNNVIGSFDDFYNNLNRYKKEYDQFVISIGDCEKRYEIIKLLEKYDFNVISLVSNNAYVSNSSTIGIGSIIERGVVINPNTIVEKGVIICANAVINHNCIIKECSHIDCNATVASNTMVSMKTKVNSNIEYKNK